MNESSGIPEDIAVQAVWKSFGVFIAVGVVLILGFYGPGRLSYLQELWSVSSIGKEAAAGAGAGVVFSSVVLLLFYTSLIKLPQNGYMRLIRRLLMKKYGVLTIAFGAGVAEEFLFRGALLGTAARYTGDTAALIIISVLFMILHIPQYKGSWLIHAVVLAMGGMLGILFLAFGALWAPITAHIVYNGILSCIMRKKEGTEEKPQALS